jgi:hypothetical protein
MGVRQVAESATIRIKTPGPEEKQPDQRTPRAFKPGEIFTAGQTYCGLAAA